MQAIERMTYSNDWLTIVIVSCFILLAVAKSLNEAKFREFLVLAFNDSQILKPKKDKRNNQSMSMVLFAIQLLSVSVFLFMACQTWGVYDTLEPFILFVRIFIFLGLFVGVKYFVEKVVGVLFVIEESIEQYHQKKLAYRNYFGFLLLPINCLFIYTFEPTKWVFWITGGVILILNVVSLIIIFRRNENIIYNNPFYFILYLCALEIAPYLILFKIIGLNTGT